MNEVERVSAFVLAIFAFFCETCNFFEAYLFPDNFIFFFEELTIFFQFSGFSIKNGINILYWVDGWICCSFGFNVDEMLEFLVVIGQVLIQI